MQRVVVVGAGLAGHNVVDLLRRKGFDGEITLVGDERYAPYDRPPLSKDCLWSEEDPQPRLLGDPAVYVEQGITLRTGTAAVALDTAHKRVELADGGQLPYDALVIASGSRARTLPALGDHIGVHALRTFDDCLAVRHELATGPQVIIVGAGLIGCEVAGKAASQGLGVTVVDPMLTPMAAAVGTVIGDRVAAMHQDAGATLRPGALVTSVEAGERVEAVRLDDGSTLPADLILVAVGAVPNVEWAADPGLLINRGVVADERCRTSAQDVYAVGDVAESLQPRTGQHAIVEHWNNAREQGVIAACEILGLPAPAPALPYFWSDQIGGKIQGLGWLDDPEKARLVEWSEPKPGAIYLFGSPAATSGALSINAAGRLMKLRKLIETRAPWDEAEALVLG